MSRRLALLAALVAAALDAGAVAVFWRVHEARAAPSASCQRPRPPSFGPRRGATSRPRRPLRAQIGGGALLLIALVAALGGIGWARRRSAGPLAILASLVPATIAGLVGAGLLGGARRLPRIPRRLRRSGGHGGPPLRGLRLPHAVPLQAARLAVVVAALLSTAAVLSCSRARPRRSRVDDGVLPPRPRYLAPGALFLVGLAAFAATRAGGERTPDVPCPGWPPPASGSPGRRSPRFRPRSAVRRRESTTGPFLFLAGRVARGRRRGAGRGRGVAHVLAQKRELWKQIQPGKLPAGRAPAGDPRGHAPRYGAPGARGTRAAGFPNIRVLEGAPGGTVDDTRTLGDVPYLPRGCQVPLAGGLDEPTARTWGGGELAICAEAAALMCAVKCM